MSTTATATTTAAPARSAPMLAVYADARSDQPLLTIPLHGPPRYSEESESATLRRRIEGIVAHEALPTGWEASPSALRDLGRLLAATYSVTYAERGQEYRIPKPRPELGWFFRTSIRGNLPLTAAALV